MKTRQKEDLKEFYNSERIRLKDQQRHNERLIKAIGNLNGDAFVEEMKFALTDGCAIWGKWQLVSQPMGENQGNEFEVSCWIDQYGPGMAGDDYHGFIYIELKKGKYLKVEYTC